MEWLWPKTVHHEIHCTCKSTVGLDQIGARLVGASVSSVVLRSQGSLNIESAMVLAPDSEDRRHLSKCLTPATPSPFQSSYIVLYWFHKVVSNNESTTVSAPDCEDRRHLGIVPDTTALTRGSGVYLLASSGQHCQLHIPVGNAAHVGIKSFTIVLQSSNCQIGYTCTPVLSYLYQLSDWITWPSLLGESKFSCCLLSWSFFLCFCHGVFFPVYT